MNHDAWEFEPYESKRPRWYMRIWYFFWRLWRIRKIRKGIRYRKHETLDSFEIYTRHE